MTTSITEKDKLFFEESMDFMNLSDEEKHVVAEAYVFVYTAVSAADGTMDEKEFSVFSQHVINPHRYHSDLLMNCVFDWLGIDSTLTKKIAIYLMSGGYLNEGDLETPERDLVAISTLLRLKSQNLVQEMKDSEKIKEIGGRANEIFEKLPARIVTQIKYSFIVTAAEVANASGGFLGFGNKVCKNEKVMMQIICASFNIDVQKVMEDFALLKRAES